MPNPVGGIGEAEDTERNRRSSRELSRDRSPLLAQSRSMMLRLLSAQVRHATGASLRLAGITGAAPFSRWCSRKAWLDLPWSTPAGAHPASGRAAEWLEGARVPVLAQL